MEELRRCLNLQISEIDMLRCMYSNPGEFIVDTDSIDVVNSFLTSKETEDILLCETLRYSVNIKVSNSIRLKKNIITFIRGYFYD